MLDPRYPHSDFMLKIASVGEVPCERLPEVFFPEDIEDPQLRDTATETAKTLCAECPLLYVCRDYAIDTRQEFGIWGGLTARELRDHGEHPDASPSSSP